MRDRGFSLLEVVVTLVIAAILAALAIPLFRPGDIDASWFQEQVKAAVRYAQRQAVAQRRTIYVCVTASQVRLGYDASCASPVASFTSGAYTLTAPSAITLAPQTFSFNGLGQPSGATTIDVSGRIVTVTAETGHVK